MKKIFTLFILVSLMVACSTDGSDAEKIKNEIKEHKKEIVILEAKITELQAQLPENGIKANKLKVRVKEVEQKSFSSFLKLPVSLKQKMKHISVLK